MNNRVYTDIHCVSKNVPPLTCCNLYIHGSIATIFGTNVAEKVGDQNVLYFRTSPNQCFCTTWETGNPEIASFHLNVACFFTKKHETQLKYHLVRAEPPFTVKIIDWVHQTGPRKGAGSVCYPHALCQPSLSRCQSLCKRWELFFVKPGVKVNGQYQRDLTVSTNVGRYQTHHRRQFFFLQEDSTQVHCACITVQLSEKCDFL